MTKPQLIAVRTGQVEFLDKEHRQTDTLVRIEVDTVPMGTVIPVEHHVCYLTFPVDGNLEAVDDELLTYPGNDLLQVINGHGIAYRKGNLTFVLSRIFFTSDSLNISMKKSQRQGNYPILLIQKR